MEAGWSDRVFADSSRLQGNYSSDMEAGCWSDPGSGCSRHTAVAGYSETVQASSWGTELADCLNTGSADQSGKASAGY